MVPPAQVLRDGLWHLVEPQAGALTINVGDMAQVLTNDGFLASNHRVLQSSTHDRYSRAFFWNPVYNADIQPLPSLVDAQGVLVLGLVKPWGASSNLAALDVGRAPKWRTSPTCNQLCIDSQACDGCVAAAGVPTSFVLPLSTTGPHYRPINWLDFRMKRFAGDYADVGKEVQIDCYRLR